MLPGYSLLISSVCLLLFSALAEGAIPESRLCSWLDVYLSQRREAGSLPGNFFAQLGGKPLLLKSTGGWPVSLSSVGARGFSTLTPF